MTEKTQPTDAEHYRNAIASACEGWTMPDGLRKHLETALWSVATSHPEAQEPLTPEHDKALIRNFVAAIKLDRHDWEDWPEDSRKAFEALRARLGDKP